jgi:transcription elongation factor GreA
LTFGLKLYKIKPLLKNKPAMQGEKDYLTQEKFDEFSKELEHLKKTKRKEVAENLEYAKSLGDLSENAEYHEARDMQANIEDRISKLELILKSATIVSSHDTEAVTVGSVVTVQKEKEDKVRTYTIVGSEEADMSAGKISIKSPLGEAIIGKHKKDSFSFTTPSGTMKYKVIDIK